jgi:hypothetical protein
LPPAPIPGHGVSLDEYYLRGRQASGGHSARLGGDRNSLRPSAYNNQRRHDGEDNLTPRFRRKMALVIAGQGRAAGLQRTSAFEPPQA